MVIDEIGKMELFSVRFKTAVEDCYKRNGILILATIPFKVTQISLIEDIRDNPDNKLFVVSINVTSIIFFIVNLFFFNFR